ncbi:uncharacterized protein EDB91DRAFT_1063789 [Suillus paluster]|uniref:uncharacterized protein n=1 Tax=Suillus paluster TaxID=48578 RepID=UPI001B887003|nr:uncharacterized protein EDB91DRAFT_1063789 [Suillus paluster]KAG1722723.1 hypothetical protein EDB91DRAFT_1063789 [Suillus paluster]
MGNRTHKQKRSRDNLAIAGLRAQKGLDGMQAAWAIKKYRDHRVLPQSITEEFDCHALPSTH